jgi:predicted glycogen debranching enzyme
MILEREACLDLGRSLQQHWLETNGRGAYAAGTPLLCPTSRYHGLLVAPWGEQGRRHVFLSRFDESIEAEGRSFPLSTARYPGTFHPGGHQFLWSFATTPHPRFTYRIGDVEVVREVLMPEGEATVLVRYSVKGGKGPFALRLRPFLPYRDADQLTRENVYLDPRARIVDGGIQVRPYASLPGLSITTTAATTDFEGRAHFFRDVEYADDLARGYAGHEDHFSPGVLVLALTAGTPITLAATLGAPVADPQRAWRQETRRRTARGTGDSPWERLGRAGDQFLVRTPAGRLGVIAGYPWFGEWGRDTAIALPGLLLARGRVEECEEALVGLAGFLRDGLLPTMLGPDPERSEYGAVDASLLFALAVRRWELAGGRRTTLRTTLAPAVLEIARCLAAARGTGLACDASGLLAVGPPARSATWMDAAPDGGPVTPRHGFPVEINALWYFTVAYAGRLAGTYGPRASSTTWKALQRRIKKSFLEAFWMPDEKRLADVAGPAGRDTSVRPNMVIAAALEWSPLVKAQRAGVVDRARRDLLTSRGLRTLAPDDPRYHGRYAGGVRSRDAAYHQGTVWPWLLGFFAEATLRAEGRRATVLAPLRALAAGFTTHLGEHGLEQVSEVFDGEAGHAPGGAFAQAWSVAELLRLYELLGLARR